MEALLLSDCRAINVNLRQGDWGIGNMKIMTSVSLLIMFIFTSNAWAAELVDEQQATLYYNIPFGGVKKSDNTHKFGFRLDRVTVDRSTGQYSNSRNINDLLRKNASLDFQMGRSGVKAFKMHGYDYLPYIVSRADENGEVSDPEAGEPVKDEEKKFIELPELNQTSFGLLLGVGIGIVAIAL